MNEKLSLPTATPIEQLQQQQAQQRTNTCATIDQTDYRYESTLSAAGAGAVAATTHNATTRTYQHDSSSNSNNAQTSGIDVGCVENGAGGAGPSVIAGSELYRYASVASLGGTSTMLAVDAYMAGGGAGAVAGAGVQATPLASSAATILKISHTGSVGGSKGSNMNSPHKQPAGAPQRDNFCGCFGSGRDPSGGAGGEDAGCVGDKQQLPTLTFWPALFANLGICTLLLGYLFIGSFLFLTIESSGDGGSAAGVVSDPNAWSYAQNAHISTQQKQRQTQQTPQASFNGAQSKLYHSSEPLLDMATATGGAHFLGTDTAAAVAAADGGQPHENSMTSTSSSKFHVNTPNAMWHATAAAMVANGTQAATPVAADAAHFDVLARAETETYTADNRHANNKFRPPPNSMSLQQQQSNDMAAAKATYATLRQAMAAEAHRAHRATNVIDAVIGNDINAAVGDVDFGLRNGDEGIEVEMADMAAENGDAWNGENVALQRTVENIWDITVSLNILYKENWTKLAALEINKFQDQLVKRLVMDLTLSTAGDSVAPATTTTMLHDAHSRQTQQIQQQQQQRPFNYHSMEPTTSKHYGNDAVQQQNGRQQQQQQRERYWQLQAARHRQWQLQQQQQQFEWNFATSFLYSLTVVTTVGYGTITPRTTLGRMVTIVYATLGIPLTLVYLSSIGSILAKLASSFCERLLCCCFCRATTNKRNSFCGFSRQQVADKKCNLKLQQLQRHHQQQHAASSAQQTAQQPTQSAHLPYCYVRPPADDTLSYGEHSPHSAHSPTTRSTAAHTLRWSLVLPVGFCVLLLLAYVTFGSLVIAVLEQWSLFDGVYFCFMSLTTIGFCDLLPGVHARPATSTSTVVVWFCAAYILSGLTLTSMCVNMLHEEFLQRMRVVVKFKKMSTSRNTAKERSFYGAPP
ncbi:uncharacterized protein LOC105220042 [Zeugodacus cucurbitae]|uniref:uncharacterized protein LOC105220042 n=1 Tax=Zeugodacus cucurbitae TaxID=28588 RepID=UPI0023D95543|nr:uncharacterized protein LOC105220042 [Zeugodacus cucurbitae]XP_054087034.1 uncharacterized protein LOC105220042 [Zeugodacus cucurbitae]XP_054087035.1 uncharacterized protein LOC105220042 [Zeugodacus cucurbitae]